MNTIVYERYMIENKVSYVLGRYYVGIIQKTKNLFEMCPLIPTLSQPK